MQIYEFKNDSCTYKLNKYKNGRSKKLIENTKANINALRFVF